jgi:ferric-dicitrate binding protein FerR (iron transport regulator)
MTKDPKKIREIARVCTTLSKSAATPEERDEFAELANKWQKFATNAEACLPLLDEGRDPKKDSRHRALRAGRVAKGSVYLFWLCSQATDLGPSPGLLIDLVS